MLEWITALSPIFSAIIGVVSYATLTNYRLDRLDEQVKPLQDKIIKLENRVLIIETKLESGDK